MKLKASVTGWHPWPLGVLVAVLGGLWVSGVVLFGVQTQFAWDWSDMLLPWRQRMGVLHGVLAWCLTLWGGVHLWPHILRCKNRSISWRLVAGWILVLLLLSLLLTAWGLMYGGADGHDWVLWVHFWPGLMVPIAISAHWIGPALKRRHPRFASAPPKSPSPPPRARG